VFKRPNLTNRDWLSSSNAVDRPLSIGPKAALGIGDGEAAQKVGGDIQNLHADFAIARDVLAVPSAKPRAYDQGPTPLSRGWRSLGISAGSCWPSASMITILSAPISRAVSKQVRRAAP
jgi:hypothetical protein